MPTLGPPPLDTAFGQRDGKLNQPWGRWLQGLWDLARGGQLPYALYRLSATQAFGNGAFTDVAWDTKVADTDSAMAGGVFTVPSGKGGLYQVTTSVQWASAGVLSEGIVSIWVAGTEYRGPRVTCTPNSLFGLSHSLTVSANAGDAIRVTVYQGSGASRNAEANSSFVSIAALRA